MLTRGERHVLEKLSKEGDLVQEQPGGWWCGDEKISGKIGWSLLRKCLITEDSYSGLVHYRINEYGIAALADPSYVSPVEKLL